MTEVTGTEAVLHGVLFASSAPEVGSTYEFLYKATKTATKAECESAGAGKAPVPPGEALGQAQGVFARVEGLLVNTDYVACLLARNPAKETSVSAPVTFKTAIPPEEPERHAAEPVGGKAATLRGILNPKNPGEPGAYQFLYSQSENECKPGAQVDKATPVTKSLGNAKEEVAAEVTGLLPVTHYTFCLLARNAVGERKLGPPETFETTTAPPAVEETFLTDVRSTSATLQAKLDPGGAQTTYRFEIAVGDGEFAPVRGPGGESLTGAEGNAGAGIAGVPLEVHVQGLAPNTAYRVRLQASSSVAGALTGPAVSFTTQRAGGAFALPDNRSWELVSPPDKHGAEISPIIESGRLQAAAGGDAFTYESSVPTEAEPQGFAATVQHLATRGGSSWVGRDLTVPHAFATPSITGGNEYRFFSSDLSTAAVQPLGALALCVNAQGDKQPCLSEAASEQTAFLHDDLAGAFAPLVSDCPQIGHECKPAIREHANVPAGTVFGGKGGGELLLSRCDNGEEEYCGPAFLAATPDFSHLVLEAEAALAPGGGGNRSLYEWAAGKLTFIGKGELGSAGGLQNNRVSVQRHSLSNDGSRIFFTGASAGLEGLLMRDTAKGETVRLDAGLSGGFPGSLTASADGSKAFFTYGGELYVFELAQGAMPLAGTLRNLTSGAGVLGGIVGAGEDGSDVYFVSNGVLENNGVPVSGAVHGTCEDAEQDPVNEKIEKEALATCNLYLRHGDTTRLVAVLSGSDKNDWIGKLTEQPTRVSPDGQWLAFMSQRSLTGNDNRDAVTGVSDAEVYLYGASSKRLVCASCDPSGARPVGVEYKKLEPNDGGLVGGPISTWDTYGERRGFVAANLPGWQTTVLSGEVEEYQSRYLSNGGRLFFNSDDALVPQDVNGTEDVYEYESPGVGNCTTSSVTFSERSGGCVNLISSGASSEESAFLDASESGGDVFFLTTDKLVPQDLEASPSVYDAHECTGASPCIAPPAVGPPPCDNEASCKAAQTPQPDIFGTPASGTFSGPGNIAGGGAPNPSPPPPKAKTAAQIRAEKLAKALKSCRSKHGKTRAACEKHARKLYGPVKRAKKSSRANNDRRSK